MIRDTLLIIDDSELDRAILNEIFKNLFHVECVANATQGMQYLREHAEQVCAVLLDLCLERRGRPCFLQSAGGAHHSGCP